MHPKDSKTSRREVEAAIAAILKLFPAMLRNFSDFEEGLDEIHNWFRVLAENPGSADAIAELHQLFQRLVEKLTRLLSQFGEFSSPPPISRLTAEDRALRSEAQKGVGGVSVFLKPGAKAILQIEGRTEIALNPRLVPLVSALIDDDDSSADLLIPWKPDGEIITRLTHSTGKQYNRHAYSNLIHELRKALKKSGENPWLVMRDIRLRRSRFALRRGPSAVTGGGHK